MKWSFTIELQYWLVNQPNADAAITKEILPLLTIPACGAFLVNLLAFMELTRKLQARCYVAFIL
jgi:hypothetical protein